MIKNIKWDVECENATCTYEISHDLFWLVNTKIMSHDSF